MTEETFDDRIMNALTKEWQATAVIARVTGINYYEVLERLMALNDEGLVELQKLNTMRKWRLKVE